MTRPVTRTGDLVLPATASREQWLAERRRGITGTDVVKIVGASRYGNALDVYLDKRIGEEDRASEAARWGQLLEDDVAREWGRRNGCQVRRAGLLRHRHHRRHLVTCDRLVVGRGAALEVKTTSAFVAADWEDGIPERVTVQTQWQMHVTGFDRAYVAALIGGQRLESFEVHRDDVLIAYLVEEADRLLTHVDAGTPPHVDPWQLTAASLNRAHPDRAGAVELPPTAGEWLAAYRTASAAATQATRDKDEARLALVQMLGDAEEGVIDGRVAFTYRMGSPQLKIPAAQVRALADAHPDIAAEYITETPGTRTFRLAK